MVAWRASFPFEFVVMLGDNIYGTSTRDDYQRKFERPYRALLDAGVEFHAAIGNHDDPGQIHYKPFNMAGRRYYTFRENERRLSGLAGAGVRSSSSTAARSIRAARLAARRSWRSPGPRGRSAISTIRSTRRAATAPARAPLRLVLEPILVAGDVDVVLSGHEHLYERLIPQRGISYFTSGGAGSLRKGDLMPSAVHAARLRSRLSLHADGGVGERAVFPGDQPHGGDGGCRGDFAARPCEAGSTRLPLSLCERVHGACGAPACRPGRHDVSSTRARVFLVLSSRSVGRASRQEFPVGRGLTRIHSRAQAPPGRSPRAKMSDSHP